MSTWKLEGYDVFSREPYRLPGEYESQASAERAALERLQHLETTQPKALSSGQGGIQDRVCIVRPDGTQYLFEPPGAIRRD